MKITFKDNIFYLQADGSLFWQKHKILILGDLHLEKSSYYAKNGNFLPPYDSIETLSKLKKKLIKYNINKVILLGDIFHDAFGIKRLKYEASNILKKICKNYEVIWIIGNHDSDYAPKNVQKLLFYYFRGITFNHISKKETNYEISAHYHPKVDFTIRGKKISKPCFLVDKKKIIIPAYGAYTGGLNIKNIVFMKEFSNNFSTYILDNRKVYFLKKGF